MSNPTARPEFLRIGQIALRTGVSAKALRLYEQRGLLKPCMHSPSGYRLYGPAALQRLMQIVLLKRTGFSLAEIGALLDRDAHAATGVLAHRMARLEQEVAAKAQALDALRLAAHRAASTSNLTIDQLLESIHMSSRLDLHFTEADREALSRRREALGEAQLQKAQDAWPQLIAQVRAAMDAGTPPNDPAVIGLARRWHALVVAFTENDPVINRKLSDAYIQEPEVIAAGGMDLAMLRFIGQAMAAAGLSLPRDDSHSIGANSK